MTDKIEELIERLREVSSVGFVHLGQEGVSDPGVCIEAADEITRLRAEVATLRTQRDEVIEECARVAASWQSSLRPGSQDRLNGHREAARDIATAIRNLKREDEPR